MIKKKKRWARFVKLFLVLFLIFGALASVGKIALSLTDFRFFGDDICEQWQPNMTEKEKIFLALDNANRSNVKLFEFTNSETGVTHRSLESQVPYRDAETILREEPDCCHLYTQYSSKTDHPTTELSTGDEGVAVLRYMAKYRDNHGMTGIAPATSRTDFNSCKRKKGRSSHGKRSH